MRLLPSACPVCNCDNKNNLSVFNIIDKIIYYECLSCYSIFSDFYLLDMYKENVVEYEEKYWVMELPSSRSRSFEFRFAA